MMIKAIILDDEDNCVEVLAYEVNRLPIEVKIIKTFTDSRKALAAIGNLDFDIIFLDIEMPHLNAFQFLDALPTIDFQIIFTTAYDHYALNAFKYYAIDYLLKPVDQQSLQKAIERVKDKRRSWEKNLLTEIHTNINSPNTVFSKIVLPTITGYEFVSIANIVRCEASSNYATIFLVNNEKILISRPLKYLQEILNHHGFFRLHQSHLVNLSFIKKYDKNDGGFVTMDNGDRVSIAQSRKASFESFLKSRH